MQLVGDEEGRAEGALLAGARLPRVSLGVFRTRAGLVSWVFEGGRPINLHRSGLQVKQE